MRKRAPVGLCLLFATLAASFSAPNATAARVAPVAPWRSGEHVWRTSPPLQLFDLSPLASGCERVPSSGYIGTGVYAATGTYLSTLWTWTAASNNEAFHWYVFNSAGAILAGAHSNGAAGSSVVTNGYRYWKVENLGASPQAWNVCFE